MEPGLRVTDGSAGHRVSNLGPDRVGSLTGQCSDPAFGPGFLLNVVKNCRQLHSVVLIP